MTSHFACVQSFVYLTVTIYAPANFLCYFFKLTSAFYIPVYFGGGYIDLVSRVAEDSMNDAAEEVKTSTAVRYVKNLSLWK